MKSFFNLLKTDLYRAILSPYFLLGTLASLLVLCMGGVGMAEKTVPAVLAFEHSYAFNNVIDLLFLSSTLAYAAQFASEWQSGYYRPVVMRSSPTQYALSKCAATGIAGGLSLARLNQLDPTGTTIYPTPTYALCFYAVSAVILSSIIMILVRKLPIETAAES